MDKTNKNPNVPNLRFNNDVFKIKKIGEIFELITGGTPSTKNKMYWNGDVPWMPSGDINKKYIYSVSKSISIDGYENSSTKYIPIHSVLIALAGQGKTRGTSAILEIETCINQSIAAILPRKDFDPYYIFHFMESKYDNLRLISSGDGGRGGLNKKLISNYLFSYPSFTTQQKIAIFLNKIDQRIQTQSKIIDDYSLLKNSISSSLFINMDVKTKLSDICIINKGQQINGSDLHENGLYYMMNGGISPSGYLNMYNKNENTISISEGGNSCGYVQFNTTKFWSGGHCYTIENLNPIINNKFLYYYLKFSESKIMNLRIGTGLPNIQKRDLEHFKVPIPNIEIQSFIINVLDCINSKINAEKQLLNLYQFQKSYLLKNMFV